MEDHDNKGLIENLEGKAALYHNVAHTKYI